LKLTKPEKITMVSANAMAAHIDVSRTFIDKLVADGVLTKEHDGRFNLDKSRVDYLRHLRRARKLTPHAESRARYEAAKARELELRNAQKEGVLMLTAESFEIVDELCGLFLTGLSGLAARCSRDVAIRRVIEDEIFKLRQSISDTAERKARELEARMQADTKEQVA
jgi:hypothetical protein